MSIDLAMGPAAALILGYLLGSIPFGLILTRMTGAGDLRSIGSGSIGATNVLRTGRKELAAATLLLDLLKGAAAVLLAGYVVPSGGVLGGVAAVIGHCYPVWLRFNGGKGVATLIGVTLALFWPAVLVFAVIWLGLFAIFRISSVAGISGALSMPVTVAVMGEWALLPAFVALALIVLWKHRANLGRLIAGTEPRFGTRSG